MMRSYVIWLLCAGMCLPAGAFAQSGKRLKWIPGTSPIDSIMVPSGLLVNPAGVRYALITDVGGGGSGGGAESDPVFSASAAAVITTASITGWNAKQAALSGSGLVKSTGGTISYIADNAADWNAAYSWGNHASAGYASTAASYTNPAWITSLAHSKITYSGSAAQYVRGDGSFAIFPVNLSAFINDLATLTAARGIGNAGNYNGSAARTWFLDTTGIYQWTNRQGFSRVIIGNGITDNGNGVLQVTGNSWLGGNTAIASGGLTLSGALSAAGSARSLHIRNTLTATANNDTLVALNITPTFSNGGFTGVKTFGLRVHSANNHFGRASIGGTTLIVQASTGGGDAAFRVTTEALADLFSVPSVSHGQIVMASNSVNITNTLFVGSKLQITDQLFSVRVDQASPALSKLTLKAGDAVYLNRAGGDLDIMSGAGAGTGNGGAITFYTSLGVAAPSVTNAQVARARIMPNGNFLLGTTSDNGNGIFQVTGNVWGSGTFQGTRFQTSTTVFWTSGTGSPEGVVTAGVGSLYSRTDGGAATTLYVKESGTGNTGWVAK